MKKLRILVNLYDLGVRGITRTREELEASIKRHPVYADRVRILPDGLHKYISYNEYKENNEND